VSSIIYILSMWHLSIHTTSSEWFITNYPVLFSFLICKLLIYIHLTSIYSYELVVVYIAISRIFTVFFPQKMILLSSYKIPRLFTLLFIGVAMGIPITNLIFNSHIDVKPLTNIRDKTTFKQYCYIDTQTGYTLINKFKIFFKIILKYIFYFK